LMPFKRLSASFKAVLCLEMCLGSMLIGLNEKPESQDLIPITILSCSVVKKPLEKY
jgi:hypothetical protein